MASFAKLTAERLFQLRAQDTGKCDYDACIQRLTDIIKADINEEHDFLRSAVRVVAKEFGPKLGKNKHQHLVKQALERIQSEQNRVNATVKQVTLVSQEIMHIAV